MTDEDTKPTTARRLRDAETEVELLWTFALSLMHRIEDLEALHA